MMNAVAKHPSDLSDPSDHLKPLARVAVHNYPCCRKTAFGTLQADGFVMFDEGGGVELAYLQKHHRVDMQSNIQEEV